MRIVRTKTLMTKPLLAKTLTATTVVALAFGAVSPAYAQDTEAATATTAADVLDEALIQLAEITDAAPYPTTVQIPKKHLYTERDHLTIVAWNGTWWVGNFDTGIDESERLWNLQLQVVPLDLLYDLPSDADPKDSEGYTGNWWLGNTDTGVAIADTAYDPVYENPLSVGTNGHWFIGDIDLGVLAETDEPYTSEKGEWDDQHVDLNIGSGGEEGSLSQAVCTIAPLVAGVGIAAGVLGSQPAFQQLNATVQRDLGAIANDAARQFGLVGNQSVFDASTLNSAVHEWGAIASQIDPTVAATVGTAAGVAGAAALANYCLLDLDLDAGSSSGEYEKFVKPGVEDDEEEEVF